MKLLVVRRNAHLYAALFPDFRVVAVGAALGGARFDEIVVAFEPRDIHERLWIESYLPLKLPPGGEVVVLP